LIPPIFSFVKVCAWPTANHQPDFATACARSEAYGAVLTLPLAALGEDPGGGRTEAVDSIRLDPVVRTTVFRAAFIAVSRCPALDQLTSPNQGDEDAQQ
jgi:hypothetical protein